MVREGMRRFAVQKRARGQHARLRPRQARAKVREEQAEKERRLARCGEAVVVALAERDAAVAECEQRAVRALRSLTAEEGAEDASGAGMVRFRDADGRAGSPAHFEGWSTPPRATTQIRASPRTRTSVMRAHRPQPRLDIEGCQGRASPRH